MDGHGLEERQLTPVWSYKLVVLSYCISWLGAYTSTQIVIHAKYSRRRLVRWIWTFTASVAFGFTAIWSMHFVGMLACGLDVRITFDAGLTVLSAVVAIGFTFAAFSSAYATEALENSRAVLAFSNWTRSIRASLRSSFYGHPTVDPEVGYVSVPSDDHGGDDNHHPVPSSTSDRRNDDEEEEERASSEGHREEDPAPGSELPRRPAWGRSYTSPELLLPSQLPRTSEESNETGFTAVSQISAPPSDVPTIREVHHPYVPKTNLFRWFLRSSAPPIQEISPDTSSARNSQDSTPLTNSDSDDSTPSAHQASGSGSSGSQQLSLSSNTLSSRSWSEPLHAGLSREARLRIKAQARDKPIPDFGWMYWMKTYYSSITFLVVLRAAVWGVAIVFMHYCGMWAMEIPEGRISWNWNIIVLSYIVAFTVCFIGCIAMVHMEIHFGRQVAFSTIASVGTCSMHYTGMWAATFYTKAPPSQDAGYPEYLPFAILVMAIFVCVISNAVLAHSAILSRNRMAEVILTKRRFWRVMAEKEAAEQANELKQQFISVASHEIRTPLHAVNGYCELLAMTSLTEEQAAYVNSIQQACHAINVIAGNVLDFSKLDRNNVELSARPVLVNLRKMVEDQARIIETRDSSNPLRSVDVIVFVDSNIPDAVYLDETYTYRILMNLLSNAQKFCEQGHVCVHVSVDSENHVIIKIIDTGCGIPKSFRNALFQPFRQADSSFTRPKQGTGLGLSIVKHLVQRMSGEIDVVSIEGEGSTFTVKLPVTLPSNSPMRPTQALSVIKRIKVVYRHERTAKLFVDLWSRHGFVASRASSTTTLQELIKDADIIWSDSDSVHSSSALRELMHGDNVQNPPLFIVHSDTQDLASLEPSLSQAKRIVLVKRPVITHEVLEMLQNPKPYLDSHISMPSRVRFSLPEGSLPMTPLEEQKELFFAATAIPRPTPSLSTPPQEGRDRVLLVEDNMVNQHLGQRLLEKLGYSVVAANNGQEAIDLVIQSNFSCCFMDCQMPILDGFAATSKIRELENNGTIHGRLPIIALTANVSTESEERCRAAGMDHFLPKPFKMSDLKTVLAHIKEPPPG